MDLGVSINGSLATRDARYNIEDGSKGAYGVLHKRPAFMDVMLRW